MRRLWMLGLLLMVVACREKAPPEGAVRVTVKYGSYRPACLRVVAKDSGVEVGREDILQSEFKNLEERQILVAVFRKAEWSRELTLEVSSFDGSTGEECSGTPVETHSKPTSVPLGDFASVEATLRAKDDDGDTFIAREEGVAGLDCDDGSKEVFPGAAERCSVAVDYDCDGARGCLDSKCQQKACDDGNACTTGDQCEGSGVSAQCKGQAVQCPTPAGACFTGATCAQETGECVPIRKQCNAPQATCIESAGTCNEATGNCEYPPKQASSSCDDRDACSTGDVCNGAGVCQGNKAPCVPSSTCVRVTGGCPALGNCSEEPDQTKVDTLCSLADETPSRRCRASSGKCSRFPYDPSNFDPDTIPAASIVNLTTSCAVTFDSTALSWTPANCVSNSPTPIELTQGSGMVLLPVLNLDLNADLRLVGNRPVILAVYENATLDHKILVNGEGTTPGAGGSVAQACEQRRGRGGGSSNSVGGGGGGAGGGTAGAAGDDGSASGSTLGEGGSAGGNVVVPLIGGCSGGSGGGGSEAGKGGAGGGSVQISVARTLTVNQEISASGGGGGGGQTTDGGLVGGGGGGGSGGQVLLEAQQLTLNALTRLTANGGGGGEGGAYRSSSTRPGGNPGENGDTSSASQANGGSNGSNSGGDGGKGGALNRSPGTGNNGSSAEPGDKGGGGGGGGAVGHVRLRSVLRCSLNGAIIISPSTNNQCPL